MSEWTTDTLHEHMCKMFALTKDDIDDRFNAQKEATEKALHSAEKAVEKAERLAELRADTQDRLAAVTKEQQNNWRASLQDMTSTYLSRVEYDAAHQVLVEKITALSHRHDVDLALVREAMGEHRGRGMGTSQAWVWVFLSVGAIVGLGGFLFGLIELLTR